MGERVREGRGERLGGRAGEEGAKGKERAG